MDNGKIQVDGKRLERLFLGLKGAEPKRAMKNGLKKSANILRKAARRRLRQQIGKAASHKGKYGKSLSQGIKSSVAKNGMSAKVHIMGDYRLKWFELGTSERRLRKKKSYRGKMKPLYFFKESTEAKKDEAMDSLAVNLQDAIIKIYRRNRK